MKISLYNASTSKSIYLGTDILSINRESFSVSTNSELFILVICLLS